ncbi:MAG: tetratricopeptide repeat protein [Saprospiraceae bacterium]|nr:tetratricopeptide repeat protein [Saprospiraceae bacterium]
MLKRNFIVTILFCWVIAESAFGNDFVTIKGMIPSQLLLADSLSQVFYAEAKFAEDEEGIARGAFLLGLTNYFQGNLYLSAKFYEEALASDYVPLDRDLAESCWNNLGIVLEMQNNLPEALEAYHKSMLIAEEKGDSLGMAETQINLGLLEIKRQNTDEGILYLEKALTYFQQVQDTINIGLCLQNIGVGLKSKKDLLGAKNYFLQSLDRFESLDHPYGMADALLNIGYLNLMLGDNPGARTFLERSRALSVLNGFRFQEAVSVSNLGQVDIDEGNFAEARRKYQYALAVFEELEVYDQWEMAYWGLLRTAVEEGNIPLYESFLNKFQEATRERITEDAMVRYDELKALYEMEDKVRQIQLQQGEIQANRRKIIFLVFFLVIAVAISAVIGFLLVRTRFLMQELFRKNEAILERHSVAAIEPEQSEPSGFDDKLWQLFRDIDTAVDRQELYRDRNLNIAALSRQFASNDTYVSKAINTYSHFNFNAYINNYRILAAQKMMTSKGKVPGIREIGDQCGFNSYTTFVRLFKQQTGLTPSQYLTQTRSDKPST